VCSSNSKSSVVVTNCVLAGSVSSYDAVKHEFVVWSFPGAAVVSLPECSESPSINNTQHFVVIKG